VFCRIAVCNLWSGREADRERAVRKFCDTDFLGGDRDPEAESLAGRIETCWRGIGVRPMLQLNEALIDAVHRREFVVAVETNGTRVVSDSVDWITVSPKAGAALFQVTGHELKLLFPQEGIDPAALLVLEFDHFSLKPMDGPDLAVNIQEAVDYSLDHAGLRLGLQPHKIWGIA
jgi:7-carboxy-7-deazaguanine synthase